jgi:Flp pilus assembly protein TadD
VGAPDDPGPCGLLRESADVRAPIRFSLSKDLLPLQDFPHDARQFGSKAFLDAAAAHFRSQFGGGMVEAEIVGDGLAITWIPDEADLDPVAYAVALLEKRQHTLAVPMLRGLLADRPSDPDLLYNLGLAESDLGQLDDAVTHLGFLVAAHPMHANAQVALGVAHGRAGRTDEAVAALETAVKLAPGNPWARRNLGAMYGKKGLPAEAEPHLREAARLLPNDQQSLYGLAHILVALGGDERVTEGAGLFRRAIALGSDSDLAEVCRSELSAIAHHQFRERAGAPLRMDAVMYLSGAMKTFRSMPMDEVKKVTLEIAVLGMQGFDVNDPAKKYELRSLPGHYSGLHLVSILYAGSKIVDPMADMGFDLSGEYDQARSLFGAGG